MASAEEERIQRLVIKSQTETFCKCVLDILWTEVFYEQKYSIYAFIMTDVKERKDIVENKQHNRLNSCVIFIYLSCGCEIRQLKYHRNDI